MRVRKLTRPGRLVPPEARRLRSRLVRLAPGGVMDWHSTGAREELLIVLQGMVVLEAAGRGPVTRRRVTVGQCAFVPSRTRHRVVNRAARSADYIYCTG